MNNPNQPADLQRDGLTPEHPTVRIWGSEIAKLTEYLLEHFPGEIGCGHANGESAVDTAIRLLTDAKTASGFLVGWWPGLEDGLSWPRPEPEDHAAYLAGCRVIGAKPE